MVARKQRKAAFNGFLLHSRVTICRENNKFQDLGPTACIHFVKAMMTEFNFRFKVKGPRLGDCQCAMVKFRLRFKQKPPAEKPQKRRGKAKKTTARAEAIKAGLAPKARQAFAIFTQEKSILKKGVSKEDGAQEMKRLGKAWVKLAEFEKQVYKDQSLQEFEAQRQALLKLGIFVRVNKGDKPVPPKSLEEAKPIAKGPSLQLGPFHVDLAHKESTLGNGTYGQVFLSFDKAGRPLAVKVFRRLGAREEAQHEIAMYKALEALDQDDRQWFPEFIAGNGTDKPWPWMALAFTGPILANTLKLHGPLPQQCVRAFVLQLQNALQALHRVGILHLDLKPANILWSTEAMKLQVVDLGMAEPISRSPGTLPRFFQYVTSLYRPPELWDTKDNLPLSRAVDTWSYGCIVFEAVSAKPLMQPATSVQDVSIKRMISTWCENWHALLDPKWAKTLKGSAAIWHTKLFHSGAWRPLVLSACAPEPNARLWKPKTKP